jgi:hypothetical protein
VIIVPQKSHPGLDCLQLNIGIERRSARADWQV